MTEAEWLACTDPQKMLEFLRGKASDRKLRLFTCACCRRIWHLLTDERSRKAVEVVEMYVDGWADDSELNSAMQAAVQAWRDFERDNPDRNEPADHADNCSRWAASYLGLPKWGSQNARAAMLWEKTRQGVDHRVARADEQAQQSALLRDIHGNPSRPVAVDPGWLTPGVIELARTIYEDRTFQRMPELAIALEEAGCQDAAILAHCRGPAPHVRGCWVVDLLLGKE